MHLMLGLLLFTVGTSFTHAEVYDFQNWMKNLPAFAKDRPIYELAIPGSHNSFTLNLDKSSDMADDGLQWMDIINNIGGVIQPVANFFGALLGGQHRNSARRVGSALGGLTGSSKDLAVEWGRTQDLDVGQQLNLGVRFFDARLGYQKETGHIRIVHGLHGRSLATEMLPIVEFARQHPEEVVIIYFRNFFNFDSNAYNLLQLRLNQIFDETLIKYNETKSLTNVTLNSINEQRQGNVVIIYNDPTKWNRGYTEFWYPFNAIVSIWANSYSESAILRRMDSAYSQYTASSRTFLLGKLPFLLYLKEQKNWIILFDIYRISRWSTNPRRK